MLKIPILFQDEWIIVINKPTDLAVHKNDFMPNDAPYVTKILGDLTGQWIYNVHRLDAKTSGIMVLALSKEVAHNLSLQFENKKVGKCYLAIVKGEPNEGTFNDKVIVKKKTKFKKPAITHFSTIETIQTELNPKGEGNVKLSLVDIKPETGRWHQIRQHFARNRYDILGDSHHGDFKLNKAVTQITGIKRLFLHASVLKFNHPITNERLEFIAETPTEFEKTLKQLKS